METAHVFAASLMGCHANLIRVEARFEAHDKGRTDIQLTGLPDSVLRESRGRLLCAMRENRLGLGSGQLNINLVPAAQPKVGEGLDLPLILAAAACRGHLPGKRWMRTLFLGEVGIDGSLHAVRGGLAAGLAARDAHLTDLVAPPATAQEAACLPELRAFAANDLTQVLAHLSRDPSPLTPLAPPPDPPPGLESKSLDDVRGQALAKFALAVCASGGHRLLMIGPPGSGKSMLAARLPGLLPPASLIERLEMTRVLAACNRWPGHVARERPFRAPHHTASFAGMVGGGPNLMPGELTLAHRGVLFLDELPEFRREVLECLRQPLEDGSITISRAGRQATLPARVHLVAAMNPCPCGYLGHPTQPCRCAPFSIRRYRERISGPLLDRLDLRVEVGTPSLQELLPASSSEVRAEVSPCAEEWKQRIHQAEGVRASRGQTIRNVELGPNELEQVAPLHPDCLRLLQRAHARDTLSGRSVQSLRRVSRTLADLGGSEQVMVEHVAQALSLRKDLAVREEALGNSMSAHPKARPRARADPPGGLGA
ncbi:MAG: YifB family Mg chelatase-like AAA ATPase [Planctomycetes bacterium]|nr:YifB family Mg chelatase-like AAA ATPase [Planctomycetota bacterium]MCB9910615.1 YifB family Mg chelatase-like AAA ATPase [Planctomycetota bacterium]HPF12999.1 YifB family Mg chelatase-like AAA ATPase [Planctomycetota bacterium]